mmetsp:Transcript_16566/g.45543  ORF Transcript_16566/g.45543 Transcript_16566/m.45543 type:complete len:268 (-) Transcript_16566:383-1186(-)
MLSCLPGSLGLFAPWLCLPACVHPRLALLGLALRLAGKCLPLCIEPRALLPSCPLSCPLGLSGGLAVASPGSNLAQSRVPAPPDDAFKRLLIRLLRANGCLPIRGLQLRHVCLQSGLSLVALLRSQLISVVLQPVVPQRLLDPRRPPLLEPRLILPDGDCLVLLAEPGHALLQTFPEFRFVLSQGRLVAHGDLPEPLAGHPRSAAQGLLQLVVCHRQRRGKVKGDAGERPHPLLDGSAALLALDVLPSVAEVWHAPLVHCLYMCLHQ